MCVGWFENVSRLQHLACGRHSVITYGVSKNGNVLDDILIGCMVQGSILIMAC